MVTFGLPNIEFHDFSPLESLVYTNYNKWTFAVGWLNDLARSSDSTTVAGTKQDISLVLDMSKE